MPELAHEARRKRRKAAPAIVYVSMHQEAIWVSVLPSKTDPGKFEHEYMVEHPRWWRVGKYPLEEHVDRLAGKLAEGLVRESGRAVSLV